VVDVTNFSPKTDVFGSRGDFRQGQRVEIAQEANMSVQRLGFLILFGLSVAAPMLSFGQTVSPVAGGTEHAAPVPDFSGMWVHPYFPGIEPPASGPGPVLNRSRRPDGTGDSRRFFGDYTNPILKPAAAEAVKRLGEISLSGMTYPTPSNRCWPSGVPYIFFQPGVQMLQLPDRVIFLYLRNHEFRQVRLNRPHPDRLQAAQARNAKEHRRVTDTAADLSYRGKHLQLV
jgi:hypothetical protein